MNNLFGINAVIFHFISDIKQLSIFKLVHYILKPTSKGKHGSSKKFWKISIGDSIASFVEETRSATDLQNIIDRKKAYCLAKDIKLQPFLIYIQEPKDQFCICYDSIFYSFDNLLNAVDILFKLFFVFDIQYPIESKKFWIFIQRFFYNIKRSDDKVSSDIVDLINNLK